MDPPSLEPQTEQRSSHSRPQHSCLPRGATVSFSFIATIICTLLSIYAHRTTKYENDPAVNTYPSILTSIKVHQ